MPAFLEDKLYLDFSASYWVALTRLVATISDVSGAIVSEAIALRRPETAEDAKGILRSAGWQATEIEDPQNFKDFRKLMEQYGIELDERFGVIPDLRNLGSLRFC